MSNNSMNLKRYLVRLSYIGTNYRGSQKHASFNIQDVDSIQGAVEASMYRIQKLSLIQPILVLAGRTDAGVHALCTTGHVDLQLRPTIESVDKNAAVQMMNRHLINSGHEIRIYSFYEVNPEFHARFSAKMRTYMYRFMVAKNPGDHKVPLAEFGRTLHLHKPKVDIDKMYSSLDLFRGTKDFKTFSTHSIRSRTHKEDEHKRNFVRTLDITMEKADPLMPFDPLSKNFDYYHITFTSTSFLYNQIRRIVGALIALGASRVSEDDIITMLQVPSHHNWNPRITPVLPLGLYLKNIEYDEDLIKPLN